MTLYVNGKNIEIIECKTFYKRLKGFMFTKSKINYGLLFNRCSSIHTFFMFQPIDVILLDKNNNIIKTYEKLEKNKIILPKKNVYKVLELPINTIKYINDTHINLKEE